VLAVGPDHRRGLDKGFEAILAGQFAKVIGHQLGGPNPDL